MVRGRVGVRVRVRVRVPVRVRVRVRQRAAAAAHPGLLVGGGMRCGGEGGGRLVDARDEEAKDGAVDALHQGVAC